ncbi:uncharacterized protein EI90DRAFT_192230 [Cantharellus anzutake]|uniref:uncharacterized protein n=1 Tax=Cantharellus anzutake TaxID=1750568 RepID=UPI0019031120|nr:uncharacterized protein EI90DRAFT_192230 [Cantharellus anzutake]KAF8336568.1 hypothetical protein EI90DRAFT_192230 [Cantharellus anzutake]
MDASERIEQALLPWCGIAGSVLSPPRPLSSSLNTGSPSPTISLSSFLPFGPSSASSSPGTPTPSSPFIGVAAISGSDSVAVRTVSLSSVLVPNHIEMSDAYHSTLTSPSPATTPTKPKATEQPTPMPFGTGSMSEDGHAVVSAQIPFLRPRGRKSQYGEGQV